MSTALDNDPGPSSEFPTPSSSLSKPETKELLKDEEYFLDAYFVRFEVEGHLFRVPSHRFFEESPEFVEIYNLGAHVEDDSDPIKLEQVGHSDFRNFMKALYPLYISLQLVLSKEEWISILTLASEWKFLRLREMARVELEGLSILTSVEQICLGRQLKLPQWVIQGLITLVQRDETISDDEAIDIDMDVVTTAYKLFRLRESRITGSRRQVSAKSQVEDIFKEELDGIRSDEKNLDDEEIMKLREEKLKREEEILIQEEEERRQKEWEKLKRIEEEDAAKKREEEEREEAERLQALSNKLKQKKRNFKGSGSRPADQGFSDFVTGRSVFT